MQSLLSPSESNAFQSFLSNMDYSDDSITPSEWALYNSQGPLFNLQEDAQLDGDVNPEGREALTKATKDLMSLDAEGWDNASMMNHESGDQSQQGYDAGGHFNLHQQEQQYMQRQHVLDEHQRQRQLLQLQQHQEHQRHTTFSSGSDIFPFLHNKMHQPPPTQELRYPMQRQQQQQHLHLALSPMNTNNSDHGSPSTPSHSHPFGGFQQQLNPQLQNQPHQVHIPQHPDHSRGISPASGSTTRTKRSSARASTLGNVVSASLPHSTSVPGASSSSGIRSNPPANGTAKRGRSSTSPSISLKTNGAAPHSQQQTNASKPPQTLLSPSQKKANHIQSEQKRRANIRRGYEALCETVPALREAIREEEEAERNASNGQRGGGGARKKSRGKKGQKDGDDKDKDKLDGRAGPRSENVVLSKTIDHVQDLIADRSALLARLHRARSSLPPGHPALTPFVMDPPWEREWKGGNGRLGDEDPEGEGESEGEEDGDE